MIGMDITELILTDHHEQRRMFALLDDLRDAPTEQVKPVWERLKVLLEVHAEAEEKLFYPKLLEVGQGAGSKDSPEGETGDALHDHNEIRDAVAEVGKHRVGSGPWWDAVAEAREANSDHMGEEEREALADFRRHASLQARQDLALQFAVFEAEHFRGVEAEDHDPKQYVAEHGGDPDKASDEG
jgi:hypothetical protein